MLSNLGNILLFLNVILSLSIIYTANRNLKIVLKKIAKDKKSEIITE